MANLDLTNTTLDTVVRDALKVCIEEIKTNSKNAGQVATGRTLKSLEWRLNQEGEDFVAQILGRKYFGSLETGRGVYNGGKSNIKQFNENLVAWFKARGIHSEMSDEQLYLEANRLRWYINKYGTILYQQNGPKDIFTPAVEGFMQTLQEQLIMFFKQQIEDKFIEGFQGFGNSALSVQ